jgi:hypothetical protein
LHALLLREEAKMNQKILVAFTIAAGLCSAVPLSPALGAALEGSGSSLANAICNTGTAAMHTDDFASNHSVRPGTPRRTALYVDGELSLYGALHHHRDATLAR